MRRVLFLFAFLVIGFTSVAQAIECEEGYSAASITTNYNGCDVIIEFCYKCNFLTAYAVNVKNTQFTFLSACSVDEYFFNEEVPRLMADYLAANGCNIPCDGSGNGITMTVDLSYCWKWVHKAVVPPAVDDPSNYVYTSCGGEGQCRTYWKYCIDYVIGKLIKEKIGTEFYSTPSCDLAEPIELTIENDIVTSPAPPNGSTRDEAWESRCFMSVKCEQD